MIIFNVENQYILTLQWQHSSVKKRKILSVSYSSEDRNLTKQNATTVQCFLWGI